MTPRNVSIVEQGLDNGTVYWGTLRILAVDGAPFGLEISNKSRGGYAYEKKPHIVQMIPKQQTVNSF